MQKVAEYAVEAQKRLLLDFIARTDNDIIMFYYRLLAKLDLPKAEEFKAAGATLVGLTAGAKMADDKMASASDNLARLAEFSKEHCRDKFPMVAINANTVKAYDVVLTGRPDWSNRTSFVIAPDGKILLSHTDMAPDSHIAKTLETVKAWKAAQGAGKHVGH